MDYVKACFDGVSVILNRDQLETMAWCYDKQLDSMTDAEILAMVRQEERNFDNIDNISHDLDKEPEQDPNVYWLVGDLGRQGTKKRLIMKGEIGEKFQKIWDEYFPLFPYGGKFNHISPQEYLKNFRELLEFLKRVDNLLPAGIPWLLNIKKEEKENE